MNINYLGEFHAKSLSEIQAAHLTRIAVMA